MNRSKRERLPFIISSLYSIISRKHTMLFIERGIEGDGFNNLTTLSIVVGRVPQKQHCGGTVPI